MPLNNYYNLSLLKYYMICLTPIELTSKNAISVLVKCHFAIKDKWTELTSLLGVPLEEKKRLMTMASNDQSLHIALEEGLKWWITSSIAPSWEELISAVKNCADDNIATALRQQLDTNDEAIGIYNIHS